MERPAPPVRIVGETWERAGRALDLRDTGVDAMAVLRAVRGESVAGLSVDCPEPGPVHDHVGLVEPGMSFESTQALAAVARCRGVEPPQAAELARLDALIDESATPLVDHAAARERVATVGAREDELTERVAALQGEVQARRELDADTEAVEAEREAALRELTDVQTDRIAAEQTLTQARKAARDGWDAQQRRLRLVDRRDNLARAADAWLAAQVADEFEAAMATLPNWATEACRQGTTTPDPVTQALALVSIASLRAPVVLTCNRFDSAETAATVLDAPVVTV
ncbi:hypothetical protein [Haloarchaeobius sp. DFWS5]|uniref:DUF7856 family protein n=1 Tax=Haloarchaeobius sp. DFWS5 TaxID=3446114 RepID=UPI003EBD09B1